MKLIRTEDAAGHVLCHDMTRIVRGEMKGPQFKKGHIVTEEDIPMLLSMGKENIYVWEKTPDMLHEDEAAEILKDLCFNANMEASEPSEGKIEIKTTCDGLLKVDTKTLFDVNSIDDMVIATRRSNTCVRKGEKIAAMRVVPLVIEKSRLDAARAIASCSEKPILEVRPFKQMRACIITTGSEVAKGRIKDTFTPVVVEKLAGYNISVIEHMTCEDDTGSIIEAIAKARQTDADMILCTGGMSVDPDDRTPGAIKESGARIVTYGAPVLPGAMFLLGYYDDGKVVMGLPGCVMYAKATIFDLMLPRIVSGERLEKKDFVKLGHGGLCLSCEHCNFPNCSFGSN